MKTLLSYLLLTGLIIASSTSRAQPADVTEKPTGTTANDVEQVETTVTSDEPTKPDVTEQLASQLSWRGTMMFNPKQLNIIYALLDGVLVGDELLQQEEATEKVVGVKRDTIRITRIVPGYNLETILYVNPQNWSFWLNGKYYSTTSKLPVPLTFVDINNQYVTLQWRDPDFNDIIPNWKGVFVPFSDTRTNVMHMSGDTVNWDYITKDGTVLLDSLTGTVQFALQPNQSFQTYTLSVAEGRSKSYYVSFVPGKGQESLALVPLSKNVENMTEDQLERYYQTPKATVSNN